MHVRAEQQADELLQVYGNSWALDDQKLIDMGMSFIGWV
jgi:hypothetical protein